MASELAGAGLEAAVRDSQRAEGQTVYGLVERSPSHTAKPKKTMNREIEWNN